MSKLFIVNEINGNPVYEGDKVAIANLTDTQAVLGGCGTDDRFEAIKKGNEVYRASRCISLDMKHCMLIKENHITTDAK